MEIVREDYLMHYNPYHDPSSGRFTSNNLGSVVVTYDGKPVGSFDSKAINDSIKDAINHLPEQAKDNQVLSVLMAGTTQAGITSLIRTGSYNKLSEAISNIGLQSALSSIGMAGMVKAAKLGISPAMLGTATAVGKMALGSLSGIALAAVPAMVGFAGTAILMHLLDRYKTKRMIRKELEKHNLSHEGSLKMTSLDYTDDPRSVLMHIGNWNSGRYVRGSGDRPYQHSRDGRITYDMLTPEGKARFELARKRNQQKKKDDRVKDDRDLIDPDKWVEENMNADAQMIKELQSITGTANSVLQKRVDSRPARRMYNMDLSTMTDSELRSAIDRYTLEQRYLDTFNPKVKPAAKKGEKWLLNTLAVTGTALTVAGSAVQIAKAIHDMKKS